MIDPTLSSKTQEIYDRNAEGFDRHRSKTLFEKSWLDCLADTLPQKAEILDLGCGSGDPIAKYFIGLGHLVTGVDFSAPMLKIAEQRFSHNLWVQMDMRQLDLSKRFDAIIAWNSFFHLTRDEQRAMFPLFANHLKPGGKLLFTTGPSDGEVAGTVNGEAIYHASLSADEYTSLLASIDMRVLTHIAEDPDCGMHTVWLAQKND